MRPLETSDYDNLRVTLVPNDTRTCTCIFSEMQMNSALFRVIPYKLVVHQDRVTDGMAKKEVEF